MTRTTAEEGPFSLVSTLANMTPDPSCVFASGNASIAFKVLKATESDEKWWKAHRSALSKATVYFPEVKQP